MTSKQLNKRSKWLLDFTVKQPIDLPSPPGYNSSILFNQAEIARDQRLVIKKSWDLALGPLKQIPMNLFIMYMSGRSISIFPIMMIVMMLMRPLKAIFSTQVTSKLAGGVQGTTQRLIYILGNLANVGIAVYKCHSLGLLPVYPSDWLAFVQPQKRYEYYIGGPSFV